jgi:hypothetical protein
MMPAPWPVVFGRPRFVFGISRIDLLINSRYHKSKPRGSLHSSAPALTQAKKGSESKMTRAGKRLSTPRRTAPKIKPKPVASNADLAEAFLELERLIHELYCTAQMAEAVLYEAELSQFAFGLLCDKVREVRAQYRAGLYAEKAVQA